MGNDTVTGLRKGAEKAIGKAVKSAEKFTDAAALQVKIRSVKYQIDEQYSELGRLTYIKLNTEGVDIPDLSLKISKTVAKIDTLKASLEGLKKQAK